MTVHNALSETRAERDALRGRVLLLCVLCFVLAFAWGRAELESYRQHEVNVAVGREYERCNRTVREGAGQLQERVREIVSLRQPATPPDSENES